VAAHLSTEKHWPNGARAPLAGTIFICSEDDVADTIRPRAEAAGANLDLLHVFKSTVIQGGKRKTFNLQHDLAVLGAAVTEIGDVALVIVDAITSYMGMIDSHRTTDVRALLEPMGDFAKEFGVSVLGITHPPKAHQANAIHAFTGSLAFVAAARLAFVVTEEPETDRRLLLSVKNNLGSKAAGIGYRIENS
jgi:putative DNA primase/helicase